MLKINKIMSAFALLAVLFCFGVSAAEKSFQEMSLEEMVDYMKPMTADQLAETISGILGEGDAAVIDKAGKAFAVIIAAADVEARSAMLSAFYKTNPNILFQNNGVFVPRGSFGGFDAFFYGFNSAFAINATPGSLEAGRILGGDEDLTDMTTDEEYSAAAAR